MDHLKLSNDIDNNPNYPSLNVSKSFSTLSPKRYSEGANVKKINNSSIDKEWKSLERSIDKMALKRYDNQTASMPKKKKKDDSSNIAKLHKHPEFAALEASLERSIDVINKTRFSNQSASFTKRPKLPLTPTATLVLNIHNHLEAKSNLLKASVRSIRVTQPVDLNVLGDYPGLIEIDLSEDEEVVHDTNDLTVVFYLPARIHFQKIKLMYGHFHNLEMLTACVNLKVLNLRGNKLEDISELCHLHTLEELNLSRNRIRDIIALNNLKNLRALNLSGNSLRDTSPLKSLVNLQHLVLIGYETNIVADLTGLIHLHTLIINSGNLNDITELKNLQQLEYLNICGNAIQDISCLTSLKKLKYLYLFDNPINDYSPLLELHLEELIVGC
ncbi:hypothetical protein HDV02_004954, partial [Globomyces sp. JEL0801]